ncbi:MAG: DUF1259 domain-containing protein [bacterium]
MSSSIRVPFIVPVLLGLLGAAPLRAQVPESAWPTVESAFGRKGAALPGNVLKFSYPRTDLTVTVRGVRVMPALALGSWVAFKRVGGSHAMVMGDLVLAEDEVAPVMEALQRGGVEQTALHNHLIGESPRVMYMHLSVYGEETKIARTVHDALLHTRTPMGEPAVAAPAAFDLDTATVAATLGYAGKVNGGVYQVSVPRVEQIFEGEMEVPASMGVATAINFQPTGGGKAAVTGDFVMTAVEVNRVIRALRDNGIDVTALHSHMLAESPRLFFMHFWANDDAVSLARALHTALAMTNVQPRK